MSAPPVTTSNGTAEIKALTALINSAVHDIVNEYSKEGHSVPSIHSTEPGPFDAPHLVSPVLAKAIQIVEAACAQLSFTVANPGHVITNVSTQHEYDHRDDLTFESTEILRCKLDLWAVHITLLTACFRDSTRSLRAC